MDTKDAYSEFCGIVEKMRAYQTSGGNNEQEMLPGV